MPKNAELVAMLHGKPIPKEGEPVDLRPVIEQLSAIADKITQAEPIDLKPFAQELNKGLSKLVTAVEVKAPDVHIDLSSLVKAVEGLKAEPYPEQGPMTFDIVRNESGYMTKVLARPGIEKEKPQETAGTLE